jgi:DNA-binding NtrC family response regulator
VLSGEAGNYVEILNRLVGPTWLEMYQARRANEVLELVQFGAPDAVVLDEQEVDALKLLKSIRRVNQGLLVVLLTGRMDRRWLEEALRLAAFSVLAKPLHLEQLLVQIQRMMIRLDVALRRQTL